LKNEPKTKLRFSQMPREMHSLGAKYEHSRHLFRPFRAPNHELPFSSTQAAGLGFASSPLWGLVEPSRAADIAASRWAGERQRGSSLSRREKTGKQLENSTNEATMSLKTQGAMFKTKLKRTENELKSESERLDSSPRSKLAGVLHEELIDRQATAPYKHAAGRGGPGGRPGGRHLGCPTVSRDRLLTGTQKS